MRLAPESSSVNIVSREFKADPFPFYARLRAEQPVCCVTVPGLGRTWLVTRYDDVVAVLRDSRFAKNPQHALTQPWLPSFAKPLQRNMLDLDEPDHARLRTLVHKAFTPSMVERLQERIQRIADLLSAQTSSRFCPKSTPPRPTIGDCEVLIQTEYRLSVSPPNGSGPEKAPAEGI